MVPTRSEEQERQMLHLLVTISDVRSKRLAPYTASLRVEKFLLLGTVFAFLMFLEPLPLGFMQRLDIPMGCPAL